MSLPSALDVATVCLIFILLLFCLICIMNTLYVRYSITTQGYSQLRYFNKPWVVRIAIILFTILWGIGEVLRLSLFRLNEKVAFDPKWQEGFCKVYIILNLGFVEPCIFLAILFLLHASLKQRQIRSLKMVCYILLSSLPIFIFQLLVVLTGDGIGGSEIMGKYFTTIDYVEKNGTKVTLCTYPILSTIFLGVYAILTTVYFSWLGKKIMSSVINKGLQKRVFILIVSAAILFPARVLLLGLSVVLSKPNHATFEALVFAAFIVLLSCATLVIYVLVYYPVADSLALKGLLDLEIRRRPYHDAVSLIDNHHDAVSLIDNHHEASSTTSAGRNSDESTKRGSISFRTMLKGETSTEPVYEELSLFSPRTHRVTSPPGSPTGQSMFSANRISEC